MSMTFQFASVQTIKSESQRALALYWIQLGAGRPFPPFTDFRTDTLLHDPKQLVVWNIEGTGRLRKFRALYQGENISDAFNATWAGKTMEQVTPMSLRRPALDAARECANSGCMVYMVLSAWESSGTRIDCERLLLPFGSNGRVEQLLGSLQLANASDARRRNAIGHFEIHTEIVKSVKVESGLPRPQMEKGVAVHGVSSAEKRRAPRRPVRYAARINFGQRSMTCMVYDISATGAAIDAKHVAAIPDHFTMRLEMESVERPCVVVWRNKMRIGVEFRQPISNRPGAPR